MATIIEKTLKAFFNNDSDIRLAFLIGSFAKGTARKDSDVDVAVLFSPYKDVQNALELKERLSLLLKKDVDMVVLNVAGPVIKMQVLKSGILLHSNKNAYENFFTVTVNEYDDLKFFRSGIEENVLRRRIYA